MESAIPGSIDQAVRAADNVFQVEMPALQAWTLTPEDGQRITQPVLYMLGGNTLPPVVDVQHLIHERLPQTEDFTVPGADHLSHVYKPKDAAGAMARFLAANPIP